VEERTSEGMRRRQEKEKSKAAPLEPKDAAPRVASAANVCASRLLDSYLQSYQKNGMLRPNLWYPGLRPMSPSFRKSCSLALPTSCGFPPPGRR
jgi:hypothetical protein